MSEFVADEIEISCGCGCDGCEPCDFMQGDSPVHEDVAASDVHCVVHRGAQASEEESLASHQRLVVAFDIRDCPFVLAAAGQFVPEGPHVPVFVRDVQEFEPVVRHPHCEPVVEPYASVLFRHCQPWHSRDILRDGRDLSFQVVAEFVGHCEICDGVPVDIRAEVVVVACECVSKSVVEVEHACDAVEPESVNVVLLDPEPAV